MTKKETAKFVIQIIVSIGICYEGGLDIRGQPADTRTAEQKASMRRLIEALRQRYPRALIVGHRDLSHDRDCPCFQCGEKKVII